MAIKDHVVMLGKCDFWILLGVNKYKKNQSPVRATWMPEKCWVLPKCFRSISGLQDQNLSRSTTPCQRRVRSNQRNQVTTRDWTSGSEPWDLPVIRSQCSKEFLLGVTAHFSSCLWSAVSNIWGRNVVIHTHCHSCTGSLVPWHGQPPFDVGEEETQNLVPAQVPKLEPVTRKTSEGWKSRPAPKNDAV